MLMLTTRGRTSGRMKMKIMSSLDSKGAITIRRFQMPPSLRAAQDLSSSPFLMLKLPRHSEGMKSVDSPQVIIDRLP